MAIILVLGGARSGKSRFAEKLVHEYEGPWGYIATAEARDDEMVERIKHHQDSRDEGWTTYEEPLNIADLIRRVSSDHSIILVDCLTLWLSNLLEQNSNSEDMITKLIEAVQRTSNDVIFVSNEVGLGIVPDNALARLFRDEAGRMNARMAEVADKVYFIAAGLPLILKDVSTNND